MLFIIHVSAIFAKIKPSIYFAVLAITVCKLTTQWASYLRFAQASLKLVQTERDDLLI